MSEYLEFEGKDVESIAQKASKKLNIPFEKLKYKVISYGSTGIFGLVGTKKARIRVAVPEKPAKKTTSPRDAVKQERHAAEQKIDAANQEAPVDDAVSDQEKEVRQEALALSGREALQKIVDAITTEATVSIEPNTNRILYNIDGGNSAILIGKHGQTLEAMQYLTEKIINRQNDDRIRVRVDIEGYLKNRKSNLKQMAERLAEKVKRTGKPASAGQMNAHDRRIIHLALKDDSGVRTQSLGDGLYRKLMIYPKKNVQKNKEN